MLVAGAGVKGGASQVNQQPAHAERRDRESPGWRLLPCLSVVPQAR
jgi:hypothetical protein